MPVTATYSGEEMTVIFQAETERSDYGVKGSPEWDEVDLSSVEVTALEILGLDVDLAALPADLQEAIRTLGEGLEWSDA